MTLTVVYTYVYIYVCWISYIGESILILTEALRQLLSDLSWEMYKSVSSPLSYGLHSKENWVFLFWIVDCLTERYICKSKPVDRRTSKSTL